MAASSKPTGSAPRVRLRRPQRGITASQILAVITLVITLYFLVDISRRAIIGYRLHRQQVELEADIEEARLEQERLRRLVEYVQTEEYAARVAREELKMVRRGERLYVVVIETPEPGTGVEELLQGLPELPPGYVTAPVEAESSYLAEWWAVFFDLAPPWADR